MAEQLTQKTPERAEDGPEADNPNGARPNRPQEDGYASLEFEQYTPSGEKTDSLTAAIRADAERRGYDTIQGLDLTVTDEEGAGRRYVVMDSSVQPVYEPETQLKRSSRPRIKGPLFTMPGKANEERASNREKTSLLPKFNGRHAFSRLKESSEYRNVGLPRLVKRGGSLEIDRDREKVDPEHRPFVTVGIFDIDGEHIATKTMELTEFYEAAGGRLSRDDPNDPETPAPYFASAVWNWNSRPGPLEAALRRTAHGRDLEIGLTRGRKPPFEDITEQLEAQGITNWTGLTWELASPGKRRTTGTDSSKDKQGIKVVSRMQTIIDNSTVKEKKYVGDDSRYARHFLIRTTEEYEDGSRMTVNKDLELSDYELWHYLEKPDDFAGIPKSALVYRMHMPGAKRTQEEHTAYNELLVKLLDQKNIAHRFTVGSNGEVDPDRRRPLLEEALGLLSLRDHTYPSPAAYPTTPEGYEDLSMDIAFKMAGGERKFGEELREVMNEVGYSYFDAAVRQVHAVIRARAESSLEHLGLQASVLEEEYDGWVADALLARSRRARELKIDDPFMAVLKKPDLLRDIIDEHVGEMFGRESLNQDVIEVPEGRDEDGKMKVKQKVVHEFNEKLFEEVTLQPPVGSKSSYSLTKGIMKWRNKIWGPIRRQTEKVYDQLDEGKPVDYYQYQQLGRMLRRTIGE